MNKIIRIPEYNLNCFKIQNLYIIICEDHLFSHLLEDKTRQASYMMMSSNGNIFRVTGPLCGEFTGPGEFPTQRPVTWSFDVFFDLRLNKRLSKQPRGWWFETLSLSLWRHCNAYHNNRPGREYRQTWWGIPETVPPSIAGCRYRMCKNRNPRLVWHSTRHLLPIRHR